MNIVRHDPGAILSSAVEYGNLVFVAGTVADDTSQDAEGQTRQILAQIDSLLKRAGTDKSRILWANVWVTDIRNRDGMNKAWLTWVADPAMLVEIACVAGK